jgi:hypothetical protein
MNTPQPVVMPQGPGGLQWNLGIPDLGGSAYTNMANSLTKSLNEGTANLSQTLKAASGTGQMLQVLGNMKSPDTFAMGPDGKMVATPGKPLLDPEMMTDIAGKGLGAQQKFIGMAMGSVQQQMQAQNEQSATQKMLSMFQQNPNMLKTKLMMSTTPGQRPPMQQGQVNVGPITQTSTQTPSQQQQNPTAPSFMPPPGVDMTTEQHNGNTVYALRRPAQQGESQGPIIHVVNPDGSPYTGGQ